MNVALQDIETVRDKDKTMRKRRVYIKKRKGQTRGYRKNTILFIIGIAASWIGLKNQKT